MPFRLPAYRNSLGTAEGQTDLQVEIITVDQTYQPGLEGDASYKPKVATWGVFPRPDNISKTFGGGRTIRPGEVDARNDPCSCLCIWPFVPACAGIVQLTSRNSILSPEPVDNVICCSPAGP